jgi:hypothetical protein
MTERGSDESVQPDDEEELEDLIEGLDRPMGTEALGTTAAEQRRGPSLEERTREGGERRQGDEGVTLAEEDEPDDEPELVGEEAPDEARAPEERAMHVREEAPGGTWDADDGYGDEGSAP